MPIVPHHYTSHYFFLYTTLTNPVILVIPAKDSDLGVINLLEPVITPDARFDGIVMTKQDDGCRIAHL
jgi:hypothetical protein